MVIIDWFKALPADAKRLVTPSILFIKHTLAITEAYVQIVCTVREHPELILGPYNLPSKTYFQTIYEG